MKKIVITGGDGDIAQAIRLALAPGPDIVFSCNRKVLDVTNYKSIKETMYVWQPDILINCAGYINPQSLNKLTAKELKRHMDVNIIGPILCATEAAKYNLQTVINIGSSAGVNAKKGWLAYCVSKSALSMFTECLNLEGIKCVTLHIGRTDTKMRQKLFPNETKELLMSPQAVAEAVVEVLSSPLSQGVFAVKKKDNSWVFDLC
jgi:NAD(P)-dependent dehydrogenase (short-subunit alcohol dehydrogenase family)